MNSIDFRFALLSPIKGQCVFKSPSGLTRILFQDELVGFADFFCSVPDKDHSIKGSFVLVTKKEPEDKFVKTEDFQIFEWIGIFSSNYEEVYANDFLRDRLTGAIGKPIKLNGLYYFDPSDKTDLHVKGRKRLTNGLSYDIVGNTIDGLLI